MTHWLYRVVVVVVAVGYFILFFFYMLSWLSTVGTLPTRKFLFPFRLQMIYFFLYIIPSFYRGFIYTLPISQFANGLDRSRLINLLISPGELI